METDKERDAAAAAVAPLAAAAAALLPAAAAAVVSHEECVGKCGDQRPLGEPAETVSPRCGGTCGSGNTQAAHAHVGHTARGAVVHLATVNDGQAAAATAAAGAHKALACAYAYRYCTAAVNA